MLNFYLVKKTKLSFLFSQFCWTKHFSTFNIWTLRCIYRCNQLWHLIKLLELIITLPSCFLYTMFFSFNSTWRISWVFFKFIINLIQWPKIMNRIYRFNLIKCRHILTIYLLLSLKLIIYFRIFIILFFKTTWATWFLIIMRYQFVSAE